jgi:predicted O-methyltransferase YrrM
MTGLSALYGFQEATMSGTESGAGLRNAQMYDFVESYAIEDEITEVARQVAAEYGLTSISAGTGGALCMLAAARAARAVVEIGTGTGVSGLWLLRGLRTDGVLTTIDVEAEHQRIAKRVFAEAGYAPSRTRVITGRGADVLPRLADAAYDLLFLDGDRSDYLACLGEAARLLRTGGVLAINGVLVGGRVADPTARDPHTVAMREVVRAIRDDSETWKSSLLPVGDGLLCAIRC